MRNIWHDIPIHGSHAFAVAGGRALFAGGYDERGRLFLLDLDTMDHEEVVPLDHSGVAVSYNHALGRGARLYLRTDAALYLIDMAEL